MLFTTPLAKPLLNASGEAAFPELLVATHNAGKLAELRATLHQFPCTLVGLDDFSLPAPVEDGGSFRANAAIKAMAAHTGSKGLMTLADDSGLCVDALGGLPGVDTSSYGGYEKLLAAMADVPDQQRTARFVCVLAFVGQSSVITYFEGTIQGAIACTPRGEGGFGYDPVFIPDGHTQTFAEMSADEKKNLSHRGNALGLFIPWFAKQLACT